ncbi:hypothetical protein WICPIJ_009130 [Wickerhamomyces pijperi]|uniref:Uncharacterized protein n=1 Tax=Wickerhamomyces pijperi TaxID=599730 RepID=A0A9P8PRP7_WICPI|nr:hypothetical protein WICPIJ_009130 [Wickerhamomyces pijperi]
MNPLLLLTLWFSIAQALSTITSLQTVTEANGIVQVVTNYIQTDVGSVAGTGTAASAAVTTSAVAAVTSSTRIATTSSVTPAAVSSTVAAATSSPSVTGVTSSRRTGVSSSGSSASTTKLTVNTVDVAADTTTILNPTYTFSDASTTYITSSAWTSIWITVTSSDGGVAVVQTTYSQVFTSRYTAIATVPSGSIGLGSLSGTVGVVRSKEYITITSTA